MTHAPCSYPCTALGSLLGRFRGSPLFSSLPPDPWLPVLWLFWGSLLTTKGPMIAPKINRFWTEFASLPPSSSLSPRAVSFSREGGARPKQFTLCLWVVSWHAELPREHSGVYMYSAQRPSQELFLASQQSLFMAGTDSPAPSPSASFSY